MGFPVKFHGGPFDGLDGDISMAVNCRAVMMQPGSQTRYEYTLEQSWKGYKFVYRSCWRPHPQDCSGK